MYSGGSADIVYRNTDLKGQAITGALFACDYLNQLLFTPLGVAGGHLNNVNMRALLCRLAERRIGFRFVVFNGDDRGFGIEGVAHNFDASDDVAWPFTHESVIAGDVGFALHTIENQGINGVARWVEFNE